MRVFVRGGMQMSESENKKDGTVYADRILEYAALTKEKKKRYDKEQQTFRNAAPCVSQARNTRNELDPSQGRPRLGSLAGMDSRPCRQTARPSNPSVSAIFG